MRILALLFTAAASSACAQAAPAQLQARYDGLVARDAQGHAPAAYERDWMEAFLAGDPVAAASWQWAYTERTRAEELHRNGGSHIATYYKSWTVTDERAVAPPDWKEVGQACGRAWYGSPLMGRMGGWSSRTLSIEITIEGPNGGLCEERIDPLTFEGWPLGVSPTIPTAGPEAPGPARP